MSKGNCSTCGRSLDREGLCPHCSDEGETEDLETCSSCGVPMAADEQGGMCPACVLNSTVDCNLQDGAGETERTRTDLRIGGIVDRYQLQEVIGEGGMGVVYRAEQLEPVKRTVALKVIKLGMDTELVIRRFEVERQSLALMDHPGIARVLDAGATEAGRPYFVMDFVEGVSITKYCKENQPEIGALLELFVQVCNAIQHAHQKGIIHRDIKPSNVLVTVGEDGVPMAKVIDFGVARAVEREEVEQTLFTQVGAVVGTPVYMSPEQAEGSLDLDTRTDIYSLGALLYEMLTGKMVFSSSRLRRAGLSEMRRIIVEEDPSRPSTRLGQISQQVTREAGDSRPGASPKKVNVRMLRGDLDWVVMKALEKDRNRRYESAGDLAAEIRRHLSNEPVLAGPPTASYRIKKFLRRNRVPVGVGFVFLVLLIVGFGLAIAGFIQAHRNSLEAQKAKNEAIQSEQVALQARGTAEELISKLIFDLREKLEPIGRLDLLEDVSLAAENYFNSLPEDQVDAETERNRSVMLDNRARVLEAAGDLEGALERYSEGLAIARELLRVEPDNPQRMNDVVLSLKNVADTLQDQNEVSKAKTLYEEAIQLLEETLEQVLGSGGADVLLRSIAGESGSEAEALARETIEGNPGIVDMMATAAVLMERLGDAAESHGDFEEALRLYEHARDIQMALYRFDPSSRSAMESLAAAYAAIGNLEVQRGNHSLAVPSFEKLVQLAREHVDSAPADIVWQEQLAGGLGRLGVAAFLQGNNEEYHRHSLEALQLYRKIARNDPDNRVRQRNLFVGLTQIGLAEKALGNTDKFRDYLIEAGEIALRLTESDPTNALWRRDYAINLEQQASVLRLERDNEGALEITRSAIAQHRQLLQGNPDDLTYRRNLLLAYNMAATDCWIMKRRDDAIGFLKESAAMGESILEDVAEPASHNYQDLNNIYLYLGQIEQERNRLREAVHWFGKSLAIAEDALESGAAWEGINEETIRQARLEIDKMAAQIEKEEKE